jgi:hypothetical protein
MSKPNKKYQPQKQQPPTASPAIKPVIELTDTALSQVTGGLNPQPLPPRGDPRNELMWR